MTDRLTLGVKQAGEVEDAFERNGGTNADIKALCKGDVVAQLLPFLRGRAEIVMKPILTFLRTVVIPAQPAVTTSKQYFEEAGVRFMENNFKSQFLGLKVEAVNETVLSIHGLKRDSLDKPVLTELGDKAEVTPSQFREFLSQNKKSGEYYLFYMKGNDDGLWVVGVHWGADFDGWLARAIFVLSTSRWVAGSQMVSRQ